VDYKKKNCLVFASTNKGKLKEVKALAELHGVTLFTPFELDKERCQSLGIDQPKGPLGDVDEVGLSYLENARLKAENCFNWCRLPSIGDDSGLEVEALDDAPGILSARYAGPNATDQENRTKLLSALIGIKQRAARYRCVLFLKCSEELSCNFEAVLLGEITKEERGQGGFGYDSLCAVAGFGGRTLAELKEQNVAVKTHRILALEQLFAQTASWRNAS